MNQFSRLFSIPLQILCRFLACKSITSVFKSNAYKERHFSFILKDDQIPFCTSKRILYLQEYMQLVGDLVLPCNTFRMLVFFWFFFVTINKCYFDVQKGQKETITDPLLEGQISKLKIKRQVFPKTESSMIPFWCH